MLLYQTCNIYNETQTLVNGNTTPARVSVYSGIKCKFWKGKSKSFSDTKLSRDTNKETYQLVIEGDKNLIRRGYIVEILSDTIGSLGIYKIENIDENHSKVSGGVDNFFMSLSKYND